MLDPVLRPVYEPPLNVIGRWMAREGMPSDLLTILGFILGIGAAIAVSLTAFKTALALVILNRVTDGLDGALARQGKTTDFGRYLDIVLDFIFYAAFVLAFGFLDPPNNALPAAILIFSLLGMGGTVLAYAVVAAQKGMVEDVAGRPWVDFLARLVGNTETFAALVLLCLLPDYFPAIALLFAIACLVTTFFRMVKAWEVFR